MEHSNDRRPWVCNRLIAFIFALILSLMYIAIGLIHIGVGSWLLVSTVRAILRPQYVERVTGKSPRFFCILGERENHYLPNLEIIGFPLNSRIYGKQKKE